MKILITGLTGTLAPCLARVARRRGCDILRWDRERIPVDDPDFLRCERPDAIAHLALGPEDWAERMAEHARAAGVPFLFTSTAMVFQAPGPHRLEDPPNTSDEYGRYKARCEERLLRLDARVARIGWQIDEHSTGNNMLAALDRMQAEGGKVPASEAWIPACSFTNDTAEALWDLLTARPGLYHLDGNAGDAWTFDRLVRALAARYRRDWQIEVNRDYVHDQRLLSPQERIAPLSSRLELTESHFGNL